MNILKKTWALFNGHKTVIGGTLVAIGTALTGTTLSLPGVSFAIPVLFPVLVPAAPYLIGIGSILGGVGWLHKALKTAGIGLSDEQKVAVAATEAMRTGLPVNVETGPGKPNLVVGAA